MKTTRLLISAVLLCAGSATLGASVIFTPNVGNLQAAIFTDFSTFSFYDVRGAVGGLLGPTQVFISDSTNGTDPTYLTIPFGNLAVNSFTSGLTNIAPLTFSSVNPGLNGNVLTLPLTGAFGTNGDGTLVPFTSGPLTADFLFATVDNLGNGQFIVHYNLQSISTPEPATFALMVLALPIFLALRRRKAA